MRNVIVTGGSRGLGLGIAGKLAKRGLSGDRNRAQRKPGTRGCDASKARSPDVFTSYPSTWRILKALRAW